MYLFHHFQNYSLWWQFCSMSLGSYRLIMASCVPGAPLCRWSLCCSICVVVRQLFLLLSQTSGHELVHRGADAMNLLLFAVSPLHAAVLEPDLDLNHNEKSILVDFKSTHTAVQLTLEQFFCHTWSVWEVEHLLPFVKNVYMHIYSMAT